MLCNMCALCKLLRMLPLLGIALASDQNVSTTLIYDSNTSCNETVLKELDACFNNLPTVNAIGIPSSPLEILKACRIFVSGMECVNTWSSTCLSKDGQEKIEGSVFGAMQIYEFLCSNSKFREDYLKHAKCYKKISPHWDNCNKKFTNTLKKVDHARDTLSLCCIRLKYFECVQNLTKFFCSNIANKFLQSITESLLNSPLPAYHSSQCVNVDQRNCSRRSSAALSSKISRFPFWMTMLSFKYWMFPVDSILQMSGFV